MGDLRIYEIDVTNVKKLPVFAVIFFEHFTAD